MPSGAEKCINILFHLSDFNHSLSINILQSSDIALNPLLVICASFTFCVMKLCSTTFQMMIKKNNNNK